MSSYVVLDLEMCRLSEGEKDTRYNLPFEIIQIGAVKLNEKFEIVDSFNSFVKPVYGHLDSFIKRLTGITKVDLSQALELETVLTQFADFIDGQEVKAVSWSMSDYKQLSAEMVKKSIHNERVEALFDNWIDCQKMFGEKLVSKKAFALEEALIASDIDTVGNMHDGYSDAVNTAYLFSKLETEPDYKLNEIYRKSKEEVTEQMTFSMDGLFGNIDLSSLPM